MKRKILEEITEFLLKNANINKAEFDKKLIDTKYQILGIKNQLLENFAKNLAKNEIDDIFDGDIVYHEQILIIGYYIAYSKFENSRKIEMLKRFLPFIDNWATCDCVVTRLRKLESEREFFINLLKNEKPFYKRVGIIWLMRFNLKQNFLETLEMFKGVKDDNYYVKMALAWAYAEAFTINSEFMVDFLLQIDDKFTRNQTISKARQSFRVPSEVKEKIVKFRIK